MKDALEYEQGSDNSEFPTKVDEFISNYLKWMFHVIQHEGEAHFFDDMVVDPDAIMHVIITDINEEYEIPSKL